MEETIKSIEEAREILESKGECCPVYVGYEKDSYTLTGKEISLIAKALYLADCELVEITRSK